MIIHLHSEVKIIMGFEPTLVRKYRNFISKVFDASGSLGD